MPKIILSFRGQGLSLLTLPEGVRNYVVIEMVQ